MPLHYDPSSEFDVVVRDVEYRRVGDVSLLARISQPQGAGPFPLLIDSHGGGWRRFDRTRQDPIDLDLARHGLVVASVDWRQAPPGRSITTTDGPYAPHPAGIQDLNYAIRWLKAHAADFNADPTCMGGFGASSGAHMVMLAALRPDHPDYCAAVLEEAPDVDATLTYIISGGAPVDLIDMMVNARAQQAVKSTVPANQANDVTDGALEEPDFYDLYAFFGGVGGVRSVSPLHMILDGVITAKPKILILQPGADRWGGIVIDRQFAFVQAYSDAGGHIELAVFPGAEHIFINRGLVPETENMHRGLAAMKGYIRRQVGHETGDA